MALWLVAVGLLSWDTFEGGTALGKWSLLLAAGAAAWVVLLGNTHEHRRVLDEVEARVRRSIQEERLSTLGR